MSHTLIWYLLEPEASRPFGMAASDLTNAFVAAESVQEAAPCQVPDSHSLVVRTRSELVVRECNQSSDLFLVAG